MDNDINNVNLINVIEKGSTHCLSGLRSSPVERKVKLIKLIPNNKGFVRV